MHSTLKASRATLTALLLIASGAHWIAGIHKADMIFLVKGIALSCLLALFLSGLKRESSHVFLGLAFLALAIFNLGQFVNGTRDCGCFEWKMPPLVTFSIDGVFSALYISPIFQGKTRERIHPSKLFLTTTAMLMVACCYLGYAGILSSKDGDEASLHSVERVIHRANWHTLKPVVVVVGRESCPTCKALRHQTDSKAMALSQKLQGRKYGMIQLDVGSRKSFDYVGMTGTRFERNGDVAMESMANDFSTYRLPFIFCAMNGEVIYFEDMSSLPNDKNNHLSQP